MDFKVAALVTQLGISPQDFESLAEENDLLSVEDGRLHDPEICLEAADHLEALLRGSVVWLPGYAPYGNLWHSVRVGREGSPITLCPRCYPNVA